jgi:hypothetical protein
LARRRSTICLPVGKDAFADLVADPGRFRTWIDQCFQAWPELFPQGFQDGYRLKDARGSRRTGQRVRRVRPKATGEAFSVRPAFLLPYPVGTTAEADGPLFLRAFGVPFGALARVFGQTAMDGYRLEVRLGRNRVVGATVRRTTLPDHLRADDHHQPRDGTKHSIATTVGAGCCLGAALAPTATTADLTAADAVFHQAAANVQEGYQPKTVGGDGWASTHQAWRALFPPAVLLRCFLHGWLNLRGRGKRSAAFPERSRRAWEAYRALHRRSFGQRLRRLAEGARGQDLSAWLQEQVEQ